MRKKWVATEQRGKSGGKKEAFAPGHCRSTIEKKTVAIRLRGKKQMEGLIVNLPPSPLAKGRRVGVIKGTPGRLLVH